MERLIDVFQDKHPDRGQVVEDALLDGDMPSLVDVDITGGQVERLARSLHGSAGPGGTNADHSKSFCCAMAQGSCCLVRPFAS